MDICAYSTEFEINEFLYEKMFTDELLGTNKIKSIARRITIPVDYQSITKGPVYCDIKNLNSDLVFELPTINYSENNGKPYSYFYALSYFKKPFSVIKLNVNKPSEWWEKIYEINGSKNVLPSEPVFVARPNAESEDDGVLIVLCLADQFDFVSILDAKDLSEICRADIPVCE